MYKMYNKCIQNTPAESFPPPGKIFPSGEIPRGKSPLGKFFPGNSSRGIILSGGKFTPENKNYARNPSYQSE